MEKPWHPPPESEDIDHRILSARIKREKMRLRILEATVRVFARAVNDTPVIEDVVKEAGIARGSFYKYFNSLDQALVAAGTAANDRMIADIEFVYGILKEPWQRASVGLRLYMVRALHDPAWATFIKRMDAWTRESAVARTIAKDLDQGRQAGQFAIDDLDSATNFFKGVTLASAYAVSRGVPDPCAYMDTAVNMGMSALGCQLPLRERAVAFSRKHVDDWLADGRDRWSRL